MKNRLQNTYRKYPSVLQIFAFSPFLILLGQLYSWEMALVGMTLALPVVLLFSRSVRSTIVQGHDKDPLTGLISRDALIDWAERALPRANRAGCQVAVMAITIDDLEAVEHRFGRSMHEKVVVEAVERLKELLRDEDVIARFGQVLAIGMDNIRVPENENLMFMAQRLQRAFEDPFSDGPTRTYCSVSLGIAGESHVKAPSGANIVAGAQRASEIATLAGAGSVRFYSGGLTSEESINRSIAIELNNALESSEIFAWFQPQVRSEDGKVTGFEALARWDHPERGLVAPATFLPDIEKAGLSQRLAEIILKQSLMALNVWDASGFDVPTISVNFSAEELKNPRLPDYIRWELDRHNIAPERLVVEVLESVASETSEDVVRRTLHTMSQIGCRIDLDDFGTGFTSFANIRRFKVDRIKIDRSLVNRIDQDEAQLAMFSALLAFSQRLGVEALAEGVETEGEAETLRSLGCRDMQGYAISRPLPLGDTLLWLEERGQFAEPVPHHSVRNTA